MADFVFILLYYIHMFILRGNFNPNSGKFGKGAQVERLPEKFGAASPELTPLFSPDAYRFVPTNGFCHSFGTLINLIKKRLENGA
jgi:hypothetical protein